MRLETKLSLKGRPLEIVDPPPEFRLTSSVSQGDSGALLVFVRDRRGLEGHSKRIVASASKDRLTWVAYPKGGLLGTDLNRDALALFLVDQGVHPVTQIAIDATWTALRFRPPS